MVNFTLSLTLPPDLVIFFILPAATLVIKDFWVWEVRNRKRNKGLVEYFFNPASVFICCGLKSAALAQLHSRSRRELGQKEARRKEDTKKRTWLWFCPISLQINFWWGWSSASRGNSSNPANSLAAKFGAKKRRHH